MAGRDSLTSNTINTSSSASLCGYKWMVVLHLSNLYGHERVNVHISQTIPFGQ